MKKIVTQWLLVVVGLVAGMGQARAQAPGWAWAHSPTVNGITDVTTDGAGNSYVTGWFIGTATFGTTTLTSTIGSPDIFVTKLDPSGTYQWAVNLGGGAEDYQAVATVDAGGNVYVAGSYNSPAMTLGATTLTNVTTTTAVRSDVFVAKLTPAGTWAWAAGGGGASGEQITAIALDPAGNVLVSGWFLSDTITFGALAVPKVGSANSRNAFVAKLDPAGAWQWAAGAGGGDSYSSALAVDATGNAYVAGNYVGAPTAFGPTTLPAPASQFTDAFVAKLDPAGAWQWAVGNRGNHENRVNGLALDGAGNLLLAGHFGDQVTFGPTLLTSAGNSDVFVAKLTTGGAWQWAERAGTAGAESCSGLAVGPGGEAYVGGGFVGATTTFGPHTLPNSSAGNLDVYVARISPAGAWQWATSAGGTGGEAATRIAASGADQVVVTGFFGSSTLRFGTTALATSGGAQRSFIARLGVVTGLPDAPPTAALSLAPNPAHRSVRLMGTAAPTATLVDGLGRTVRTWPLTASPDLDLTGLPAGLYTVRAGAQARRLVVE